MYFLIDACQHPDILRTLYFLYLLLNIVFVVIPIGLIIMLMIDFSKSVITGEEKEQIKSTKLVTKRIMYAVIIFVIPWVVNVLMIFIETVGLDIGGDYRICITNVKDIRDGKKTFEYFDSLLETEEKIKKSTTENNGADDVSTDGNHNGSYYFKTTADAMINLAKGELDKTDGTKYGGKAGVAWCGYFTTWVLKNTKMSDETTLYNYINKEGIGILDGHASGTWPAFRDSSHLKFYKSTAYGGTYNPKKGDIVWFHWAQGPSSYCRTNFGVWDGKYQCADHVGIVEYFDGTYVHTVEGNTSGAVKQRKRDVSTIVAYGSWYE